MKLKLTLLELSTLTDMLTYYAENNHSDSYTSKIERTVLLSIIKRFYKKRTDLVGSPKDKAAFKLESWEMLVVNKVLTDLVLDDSEPFVNSLISRITTEISPLCLSM